MYESIIKKIYKKLFIKSFISETLEGFFHFKNQTYAIANAKTCKKVSTRFGVALDEGLQY
jgi:hypothetical protein